MDNSVHINDTGAFGIVHLDGKGPILNNIDARHIHLCSRIFDKADLPVVSARDADTVNVLRFSTYCHAAPVDLFHFGHLHGSPGRRLPALYGRHLQSCLRKPDQWNAAAVRQAVETEMRATTGQADWRCVAVNREAKIRPGTTVEVSLVQNAITKMNVKCIDVVQDGLFPVKVDNANRTEVTDADGAVL